MLTPCPAHRFNFKQTVSMLLDCASINKQCSCKSYHSAGNRKKMLAGTKCSPNVHNNPENPRCSPPIGGLVGVKKKNTSGCSTRDLQGYESVKDKSRPLPLWGYEIDSLVTVYWWIMQNRSLYYPKCSKAVIVYQMKRSTSLPPGLYVYRTPLSHFGCTVERPLKVLDQFNFVSHSNDFGKWDELPSSITIDMFPGHDNISVVYKIKRPLQIHVPEYGDRLYGEARAMGVVDPSMPGHGCAYHNVALRTKDAYVIDLRWKGFHTKTACIKAIPRLKGMQAVVWSNHNVNCQNIECAILQWILGLLNELPKEVQMIDYSQERLGVMYIQMEMDTFPGLLPEPPSRKESFFIHAYFIGDYQLATNAIGEITSPRSRIGTPCLNVSTLSEWYILPDLKHRTPTPFDCGLRHECEFVITEKFKTSLQEWIFKQDGSSCQGLAVQFTLYYDANTMQYKTIISHTVMANDSSLNFFKL